MRAFPKSLKKAAAQWYIKKYPGSEIGGDDRKFKKGDYSFINYVGFEKEHIDEIEIIAAKK